MRVGVIGLLHESNTFIDRPTTLAHFEQDTLLTGRAVRDRFAGAQHEIGGFFAGLESEQIEAVPIFAARAIPYGPIEHDAFMQLVKMLAAEISAAGQLDGMLVAPHGATVCESIRDADGYWLSQVRHWVGDHMPIVGTLDAHANLSSLMIESTNALIAYRTNPHVDQRERGIEAARLIARTLRREIKPVQQAAFPALAINIERQLTTAAHLAPLYAMADDALAAPGVVSNSILLGFPYADVEEMGSATLVVADDDQQLAARHANELADFLWQHRREMEGTLTGINDALQRATALDGSVCMLDMGDNVGGGGPGDSTHLAHAIQAHQLTGALVCINDPAAAAQATAAGTAATIEMQIGGKTDALHGTPLCGLFDVLSIHEGAFTESQIRHGGFSEYNQGQSAVVRSRDPSGLTVLLTSRRTPPFSLQQLTSCGIEPSQYRFLIAKGVIAPVAAYRSVCKHFIRVNTPGCTTAEMQRLTYRYRRRPMYPFEGG